MLTLTLSPCLVAAAHKELPLGCSRYLESCLITASVPNHALEYYLIVPKSPLQEPKPQVLTYKCAMSLYIYGGSAGVMRTALGQDVLFISTLPHILAVRLLGTIHAMPSRDTKTKRSCLKGGARHVNHFDERVMVMRQATLPCGGVGG